MYLKQMDFKEKTIFDFKEMAFKKKTIIDVKEMDYTKCIKKKWILRKKL